MKALRAWRWLFTQMWMSTQTLLLGLADVVVVLVSLGRAPLLSHWWRARWAKNHPEAVIDFCKAHCHGACGGVQEIWQHMGGEDGETDGVLSLTFKIESKTKRKRKRKTTTKAAPKPRAISA